MCLKESFLGYPSFKTVSSILESCNIKVPNKIPSFCKACCYGKSHKQPFFRSLTSHSKPLELVYTDLWGPAPVHSTHGFIYYIIFVDSFSQFTWVYMLKRKSEALLAVVKFKAMAELQFDTKIKALQLD